MTFWLFNKPLMLVIPPHIASSTLPFHSLSLTLQVPLFPFNPLFLTTFYLHPLKTLLPYPFLVSPPLLVFQMKHKCLNTQVTRVSLVFCLGCIIQ